MSALPKPHNNRRQQSIARVAAPVQWSPFLPCVFPWSTYKPTHSGLPCWLLAGWWRLHPEEGRTPDRIAAPYGVAAVVTRHPMYDTPLIVPV